jgi:hypothetical protein
MRVLYIEGVAIHGGPVSCGRVREGVVEALIGVRAGWVIEPRNIEIRAPTLSKRAEGEIGGRGIASGRWALRGQRAWACTRVLHAREPGGPMLAQSGRDGGAGRGGNAEAVSP